MKLFSKIKEFFKSRKFKGNRKTRRKIEKSANNPKVKIALANAQTNYLLITRDLINKELKKRGVK